MDLADDIADLHRKLDTMIVVVEEMSQAVQLLQPLIERPGPDHPDLIAIGGIVAKLNDLAVIARLMDEDTFPNPFVMIGRWVCWKKNLEPDAVLANLLEEYKEQL